MSPQEKDALPWLREMMLYSQSSFLVVWRYEKVTKPFSLQLGSNAGSTSFVVDIWSVITSLDPTSAAVSGAQRRLLKNARIDQVILPI